MKLGKIQKRDTWDLRPSYQVGGIRFLIHEINVVRYNGLLRKFYVYNQNYMIFPEYREK